MKKINLILLSLILACMTLLISGCYDSTFPHDDLSDPVKKYDLNDHCFIFDKYEVIYRGPTEEGDRFSVFASNTLELSVRCITSANEIIAHIDLYDAKGKLLGTYISTRTDDVEKDETFIMGVTISDSVAENLEVVKVRFEGIAIKRVYRIDEFYYNVTLVFNNGTPSQMMVVKGDYALSNLEIPKKTGYVFVSWYTDPECTKALDIFGTSVEEDLVLYAGYMIDYIEMGNHVVETANASTVHIKTKSYSTVLWGMLEVTSHEKEGEGVIILDEAGYYYVMTTNDLVQKKNGYENVSYVITDCNGNEYEGKLKHSGESYNLGVLYFEKPSETVLGVIELADTQPEVGDIVAILTGLLGDMHYPNFGDVLGFEEIKHKNTGSNASDMNYLMMVHNTKTDRKVTGRPLLDMNLKLVGIQCGTLTDETVEFENPHVIPWSVIKKYIDAYGI